MSHSARSVWFFGLYLIPVGLGLLASPNTVLIPLGFPASTDVWPRVVGVLALVLAYYYIQAARGGSTAFFRWSVQARTGVCFVFVALALIRFAPPPLAMLGVVDLLGAAWTALALRAEARA
ncbi:MAG: hypothetical protein EXS37_09815 [Opitutus sp.]|nr:hypothetical protein [Opitutus sp.]